MAKAAEMKKIMAAKKGMMIGPDGMMMPVEEMQGMIGQPGMEEMIG